MVKAIAARVALGPPARARTSALESDEEEEEEEHAELDRDSGGEDGGWDGGGSDGTVVPPLLAVGCWLPIVACCVSCGCDGVMGG